MIDFNNAEKIKEYHKAKAFDINDRTYTITSCSHVQRKKVFGCFTANLQNIRTTNLDFINDKSFKEIEKIMSGIILFDGMAIDALKDHWDKFPEDYIEFIMIALGVISYPFMKGNAGG